MVCSQHNFSNLHWSVFRCFAPSAPSQFTGRLTGPKSVKVRPPINPELGWCANDYSSKYSIIAAKPSYSVAFASQFPYNAPRDFPWARLAHIILSRWFATYAPQQLCKRYSVFDKFIKTLKEYVTSSFRPEMSLLTPSGNCNSNPGVTFFTYSHHLHSFSKFKLNFTRLAINRILCTVVRALT